MLHFSYSHSASGAERQPRPSAGTSKESLPAARKFRAVIIEDELIVAWALENTLENLGHEVVDIHPTGESAVSAGIGDATLLIVDINLGDGMDGIATAAELRRATDVAIIFCSAYSGQETRQRAAAAVPGASFITKPFVERDLENAIKAVARVRH